MARRSRTRKLARLLTGEEVLPTASVTTDLTVATDTLVVSSDTNRVGIGTDDPAAALDVIGEARVASDGGGTSAVSKFVNTGNTTGDHSVVRVSVTNPSASSYIQFGDSDDANVGQIRYNHSNDEMTINVGASQIMSLSSDIVDLTGMRIRNSGVRTFLGSISNNTDVATIDITWSDFGIDPTNYQQLIIEGHNMGVTASAGLEFRFFFDGTLFNGANYRWASHRGYMSSSGSAGGGAGVWNDTWGRFSNANDSTSHWHYFALTIPNPGKNAYSQYATTAYQGWWSTSRGVDASGRPRAEDYAGFVSSTTSRNICTGVRLDHTAAANFRNTDIKIYGVVN